MVSSGEPQVSGFSPILCNVCPTGGRVAVSGCVCGKRVRDRGFQGMHVTPSPGGEAGLAPCIKDREALGVEGGPMSEFCHSAGPEIARTVWQTQGAFLAGQGRGLAGEEQRSGVLAQPQVWVGPLRAQA